jgi:pimeloyl-ACP methyl ester carboxylesterase
MRIDEVGDPDGAPVVYLHGGGDSRLTRHPDDSIAARLGVRLLALERSGPAVRRRSLRAWAEEALASLPVDRFATLGWSAGGPHALALAAVAPERVTRVALVGSMPPPNRRRHLSFELQRTMLIARYAPKVVARGLEDWARKPTLPTGAPETDEAYARGRAESFRDGGMWLAHELAYLGRPWGFELGAIEQPVTLWWGERDRTCPPPIAQAYLERLPNAELHLVDDNHQLLFRRWEEILASAVGAGPRTRP